MKVSKLGITMYEPDDPLPAGDGAGQAIDALRVEVNKIAEALDALNERLQAVENVCDFDDLK